jgi:hypothetical protein
MISMGLGIPLLSKRMRHFASRGFQKGIRYKQLETVLGKVNRKFLKPIYDHERDGGSRMPIIEKMEKLGFIECNKISYNDAIYTQHYSLTLTAKQALGIIDKTK